MKRLFLSGLVVLTFCIFCAVIPAEAAITLTQHAGKDAGSVISSSQAFASSNTVGNFLAVMIRSGQSGETYTVSDSRGNTYRQAIQFNVSLDGDTLAIFYAENIAGGANTVTVGQSQSATLRFAVMEYSGVATFSSLDGVVAAQANSLSPNSGTISTTTAGDLLLGVVISANESTFTAGANFTIEDQVPAAPNTKIISEDRIQTAAGPAAATATLTSSDIWGAAVAAFRPATVIVLPDLGLSKSHVGSFTQGQTGASYSITVSNIGAGPTSGTVTMTDTLPAGLTATALTGTGWNCTVVPASCNRSDVLSAGASYPSIAITVNVASNAPGTLTNTASVSGGGEVNTTNDSASDVTTINAAPLPDLTLTKTHVGAFTQGQTGAVYTITVTNSGPGITSGTVTMTDTLPTGFTATALSGTGWSCTVSPSSCTRSDVLASGASYPAILLTVSVAANAPGSVTNTASVSGGGEVNTTNDSASDVTTINAAPLPDLTLTKTHVGAFTQGQTGAVYTITVTNSGPGITSGTVTMTDTLPIGLTATALSGTGWNCTVAPASCTRSDVLAASASYPAITLTVSVDSNAPGSVTNTASVIGGGEVNTSNNSASDVTAINLLDTISPSAPGTLSATAPDGTHINLSWGAATDNVGVTGYQVARCDGTCSIAGGGFVQIGSPTTISFSDSALTPGATYSYAVRAVDAATNSGPYSNVVTLSTPATIPALVVAFSFDEPSGAAVTDSSGKGNTGTISNATRTLGKYGNALSFNGTNAIVNVVDSASLHLTTTMTLEAWVNPTTSSAAWRDVIYKADDNYYLEGSSTNGGSPAGGVRGAAGPTYGTSPLPINTWSHLAVTYDGTAMRLYVNGIQVASQAYTGTITTSTNPLQIGGDSLYGQFFSGLIDEVRVYNIALTPAQIQSDMNSPIGGSFPVAGLSPASLNFGTVSTGTTSTPQNVTLTNTGGAALAISGISTTGANSTDFSQSNNCTATLATNASCTISVTFTPTAAGARAASVQVSDNAAGAPQMVALAGTGQSPSGADLTLTKTHTGTFTQGQSGATYSLVVRNSGTSSTSGTVTMIDTVPAGLTATAISGTGWNCTLSTRTCTRSTTLAANSNYPTITLTVSVASNAPGSVTNTATVSGGGETNTSNDSASDVTTINPAPAPDLTLTKTHSGAFTQGQTGATYSLVARNSGTATTSGTVTIIDTLPAGLTATAVSGTGWSCILSTLTCTSSTTLAANSNYPTITLTVNVASNAPASVTNNATVSGGGETNTANDTASDPTTINPGPQPDLTLTKTHTGTFTQGQSGAVYTITVTNSGPGITSGTVTMTDTLPTGLTPTALSGTGWSCTVTPASCTRSDVLAASASYPAITLTVNVASNAPGTLTNTASVSGGGEVNTTNDSASDVTTINAAPLPDLTLTKTHVGAFTQGQTGAVYTITVTNSGLGITSGTVTMTDTLPTGLTPTALSGTGWSCTVTPASCTRSDVLAASASYPAITLTVNVASNAPGTLTNTASVSGGGEVNTTNDSASDVTTINAAPLPDLTLTKTHVGAFTQGQTGAVYTITVTNSGPGITSGTVTMTDTLPIGLTATALSGTGWNCTVAPASCTRSDVLAASASYPAITLTVSVDSNAPGSVTNTASVIGGGEVNTSNNSASDVTAINLLDTISPSAPGTLSATAPDGTHINLSWGAATDNVGVTGYQVARCDGTCSIAGGGFVQIGSPTTISFSDSALTPGATYSYAVRAVDAATNSGPYSNVVTLSTPATIPALVVAFSFDEPSGAAVTDSSGKGNTGTISNATRTLGKYGSALSFNGANAIVNVLDSASLHLTTTMTLEAWVNPTTSSVLWSDVIYKADDNYFLEGTSTNGGAPAGGTVGSSVPVYGTSPLPVNTWSHLAVTYDGTALRLYVNGTQVGSQAYTGTITTSTNPLQIGGDSLYGQFFSGLIDEVRVYNIALTPAQIQSDMNSPVGGSFPVASLSPASLNFGTVSTGTTSSPQNVTLTNTGGAALAISGISTTGANSTDFSQSNNCTATLATNASCTISVTFTPTAAGARAASVQVSDNAAGAPQMVALAGTGQSPSGADLTLTKTHTGTFTQGQSGATYSLVVRNSGTSSTSGTVTMIDTLPAGLTATAISGTGWSCTLSSLTCTRSTALAANSNYPTITLTVNVASNAPASVTNTATVSGGGETNTANDTASDPTTINAGPQPDLTLTKTHTGVFTQGQTGATYSLVARNSGTGTTAGTVTVIDTLPAGLTATAISGTGWSCLLSSLTCTSNSAVAANSNYPVITLVVDIAANAPANVTNTASLSGGGETNVTNNNATDVTLIGAPDSEPPSAPGLLSGNAPNGTHVDLTWGPATDNVGVTDYRVERCDGVCTVAGGGFVKIAAPLTTSFSDSGLAPSTTYSYVVRAEDAASNLGPYSNVVTVTTLATIPELVAAFSFDEPSGATVADSSGKGNNGTISNATRTLGKYGSALSFNGTNALVSVVDSASLHLTTAMTLEAWVNPATPSATWRDVIYKADDNYYLEASSSNAGLPAGGTAGSSIPAYGTVSLSVNTWSHLALTYDGSALRLYVNGTQVGSQTFTGSIATSANPLQIGGDSLYGQFFNGLIDEVRVYNIALTPTQILSDMNSPLGNSFPLASLSPTSLNFGTVSTGTPSTPQNVTLTNSGGVALTITGVSITGANSPDFSQSNNCPASLATNASCTIAVTFTPAAVGAEIASIRIDDNAAGSPHLVPLNGTGAGFSITPRISVLTPTMSQQFGVTGGSGGSVQWAVDGLPGGSATAGTISGTGLYSPPQVMGTHTVAVTDQAQTSTATVYVTTYPGTLTHHNDNQRTGQNLNETVLTPANVNPATFGKLLSYDLDGLSMASPLYVAGVTIPAKGVHNVVYVATQHDSVYAFDADGLSTTPLWKTSFLVNGAVTVPASDTGECCDIAPEIGITGTPVIDLVSNTLYVVAKTKEGANYIQRLHALDITTGVEKIGGWPLTIQASVSGTGQGSSGGEVQFDALHENQRPALLLSNGVVYIAFGSHGDIQPYHGWVLGYNVSTLQQTMTINLTPNAEGGGIWQANGGPATDSNGNVYIITGNGAFSADAGNGKDYGDSFVKISTAGASSGTVVDYFTPYDQATIDAANFDLGAAGPLLLPDQPGAHPHLMVSAGKNNTIYLVDRDNMGHINSANNDNQIVQSLVDIFPFGTPEPGNYSGAVYFNGTVYFGPIADNIQAFQLTNGLLSTAAVARSQDVYKYPGAAMAISANGASSGLLWAIQRNGDCGALLTCSSATPGVLHAYDTSSSGNVLTQVYSSDQMGTRDTMDFATKFSIPLVANGKVFVTSMSKLTVFGLLP